MSAPDDAQLEAARAKAMFARARLHATFNDLQQRLAPAALAETAMAGMKSSGARAVDEATSFARQRPGAAAGVGLAAMLFLFRRPIARLFRRKPAPPTRTTRSPPASPSRR